jgi:hypothetical protein
MSDQVVVGSLVTVTDYRGAEHDRVAISERMKGWDFEVVRICRENEWFLAGQEGREPRGMPWPATDVRSRNVPIPNQ